MRRATALEITARRPPPFGRTSVAIISAVSRVISGLVAFSHYSRRNFDPYLNDELTKRVKRALKSGRKMRIDADGRSVDVKTGELIGPDPAIEQPLTKAQLGKAVVRRGAAQSRSQADHDAAARPGSPETFP